MPLGAIADEPISLALEIVSLLLSQLLKTRFTQKAVLVLKQLAG